jgi:hypothetical protein
MARKAKSEAVPKTQPTTPKAIISAYRRGASLPDLKLRFGVKSKAHLAKILLESEITAGKLPPLTGKTAAPPKKEFTVLVNKRGTIVLPKEAVIDTFKMQVGQKLVVRKRGKNLRLSF